jgi:predicted NUDIX family NTP pyrophosphohydrolase
MAKTSAGLLMFRFHGAELEFLLAHPGGPFWKNKDSGAWTIPKGEINPGEDPLEAAKREFFEETGVRPEGPFSPLPSITQKNGKTVLAWAFKGDCDPRRLASNVCSMEWPPRSGKFIQVPEVDRAEFFPYEVARRKINPAQVPLLDAVRMAAPGIQASAADSSRS